MSIDVYRRDLKLATRNIIRQRQRSLFALTIKRLHDLGHSGWWSALLLAPGISVLLMLFCAMVPARQPAAA